MALGIILILLGDDHAIEWVTYHIQLPVNPVECRYYAQEKHKLHTKSRGSGFVRFTIQTSWDNKDCCSGVDYSGKVPKSRNTKQKGDLIMEVRDILVETDNPEYLDDSIQNFGASVVGRGTSRGFIKSDGKYVVRCFGDVNFIAFTIENQGYGKVKDKFGGLYTDQLG